ncbi:hypothetical protein HYFRA_00002041 [Hymenoscyphus fraxineus]|uniref:Uncharacterized protein n=1 Tax=Hymenoscyphus fraxineus TaxID=746836 RepID=A0A9N9KJT1_9HELO|nr:hypothetical protein HYFRA_00002041 [Hymenoscyphus fraxineus]
MTLPPPPPALTEEAQLLVAGLASKLFNAIPHGSISVSTYDTAWTSMISKPISGNHQWLFPSSFSSILQSQNADGGWGDLITGVEVDDILNSMSALLALLKHRHQTPVVDGDTLPPDIDFRITDAVSWLERKLRTWDVESTEHVCFEMLVPMHLQLLREFGFEFQFPGFPFLMELHDEKVSNFDSHKAKDTFLYPLEAFIGVLDFDELKMQLRNGSFMSSPASTAAYLIYASVWDEEAEEYLQTVYKNGSGNGTGEFPSAFPSELFESSWMLSTLLQSGFTTADLGGDQTTVIGEYLEKALTSSNGTVGFTLGAIPDADNTAKAILTLSLLNREYHDPSRMITSFFNGSYFQTYPSEQNPSFSATCNVLIALLHLKDVTRYEIQIASAVDFLCSCWSSGSMRDKWTSSPKSPQGSSKPKAKTEAGPIAVANQQPTLSSRFPHSYLRNR